MILIKFKENFERTYCDFTKINGDNELIIKNSFIRLKRDMNFNLWIGIGKASVTLEETKQNNLVNVKYTLDFTRLTIAALVYLTLLLGFYFMTENDKNLQPIIVTLMCVLISVGIFNYLVMYFRHKSIFLKTIKNGSDGNGYYDWETILKKKTNDELKKIVSGNTQLPSGVEKLAKMELDKRG